MDSKRRLTDKLAFFGHFAGDIHLRPLPFVKHLLQLVAVLPELGLHLQLFLDLCILLLRLMALHLLCRSERAVQLAMIRLELIHLSLQLLELRFTLQTDECSMMNR